ncbi:MAG: glycoside hydrolase family 95 protein [Lachnospiraceae bacterium]|nr:glycoside hydrolase family 95 protein [Lachnospiraceae bacterium]
MKNRIYINKAKNWEEGLPIGNGRLGASILGKIAEEMITINEETIWYGPFRNRKNPDCREHMDEIRRLLLKGEVEKAQFMAKMAMTSTPKYMNPYQPAGDLKIQFPGQLGKRASERSVYLDLDEAAAYVKYTMNYAPKEEEGEWEKVRYERKHFVSQKYNVVLIRLTCDTPGRLTISANMNRKPFEEYSEKIDSKTICNYGQCGAGGVHYFTGVRMTAKGGEVKTMGDFVYVEQADEVILYVTAETDFGGNSQYRENCLQRLDRAEAAGYEAIWKEHLSWFEPLFNRTKLELNACETDERLIEEQLEELKSGERESSDYLTVLLFNYAKYLMICSSYDCQLPANLQGIWNGEYVPPWQSEFTININTEMNYWFVEKCQLPECHMPLFRLIDRLVENGRKTAQELYGCRGFCAHHNTSLWANTDPEGIMDASPFWPMGGAWLSLHMYEHYLYTGDEIFLKERALPVMREAIRFFEDYLYEMEDGTLVTGPSVSPENTYLSSIGQKGALCMGPAMDIQILRQLFSWYLEGSRITDGDAESAKLVAAMLSKLPKTKISSDGRVMEWQEEYKETEPGHRHISHMYGLHPGNEITEEKPELFAAAEKTIDARLSKGGGHTGWSRAWIACFFARLKKGEKVYENINGLLKKSIKNNLYDTHPPFQIDGNFGIAEAILEALIQSHNSYIELLPALPQQWKDGGLTGVRLRGGLTGDLSWKEHKVMEFAVTADKDMCVTVKYKDTVLTRECRAGERTALL